MELKRFAQPCFAVNFNKKALKVATCKYFDYLLPFLPSLQMDPASILALTGGLPPSAFQASTETDSLSPFLSSCDADNPPAASPSYFQGPFTSFKQDRMEWLASDCFDAHHVAEDVDSWFAGIPVVHNTHGAVQGDNYALNLACSPPLHSHYVPPVSAHADIDDDYQHCTIVGGSRAPENSNDTFSNCDHPPMTEMPQLSQMPTFLATKAVPAEKKAGSRRSVISKDAKDLLEASFSIEPYPDTLEVSSIATNARLGVKQVKTWFSNKRHRATPSSGNRAVFAVYFSLILDSTYDHILSDFALQLSADADSHKPGLPKRK